MAERRRHTAAESAMTPELLALLIAIVAGIPMAMLLDRDAGGGEAILFGVGVCAAVMFVVPWPLVFVIIGLIAIGSYAVVIRPSPGASRHPLPATRGGARR